MSLIARAVQPLINAIWYANNPPPRRTLAPNPHLNQKRSFYSTDLNRILHGWTNISYSIDNYLQRDLTSMRARSRELVRQNSYAKKFVSLLKSNIVGPKGVDVQAQVMRMNGEPDTPANDAIESAWRDWAKRWCDVQGRKSLIDFENMAIHTAGQDGEYLIEMFEGRQYGRYGFQIKFVDPELLDTEMNEVQANGNVVRLGVEYHRDTGRRVRYHFRTIDEHGNYTRRVRRTVRAENIIHAFIEDYPDQSRGFPWLHASLQGLKQLGKYDEAAMIAARFGASKMIFLSSDGTEDGEYQGDELGTEDRTTFDSVEPGSITDIGTRSLESYDPNYPHEMYASFVKSTLRSISTGGLVSYASMANDLEDVNFSSIRHGVLEEREIFMALQEWFIRTFMEPVYERWLTMALMRGAIRIGRVPLSRPIEDYIEAVDFRARRWHWIDPLKDMTANINAIKAGLKSRGQVMREQGNDPDATWKELQRENEKLREMGIIPEDTVEVVDDDEEED